ncbi:hypothetical protein [Streptomyces sp. HNM0574]|uniref:hypothetical protein n=1 Tax=Streptomyces sp. HNM0574 TaxID=2714954 RepID=UPI00146C849D|nr:hypothetical protein [Streptomyces sp. HNM0574]NLU67899.1 hypothetical protein [Streptomyces sp. HNM0574]
MLAVTVGASPSPKVCAEYPADCVDCRTITSALLLCSCTRMPHCANVIPLLAASVGGMLSRRDMLLTCNAREGRDM